MAIKRDSVSKWHYDIGPRIFKILEKNKERALHYIPDYCGENKFEVRCFNSDGYYIDLNLKTCSCRRWNLTGILCPHAISYMEDKDIDPVVIVNECYSKNTYEKAYHHVINPLNGLEAWKKTGH
ncbi:Zinc finger, PMZ-type [Parasponia andersonii]|uniref:Zinc finger, PMZ-type n=1 Tax=Parasponia andersonii TaxID=3476 RepID=A0A2P5ABB9_PARAD|nr:Zinc finger, PMZ-type [Parasponia andersonii]